MMSYYNSFPKYKRVLCECGCILNKTKLKKHLLTDKHKKLLNEKKTND